MIRYNPRVTGGTIQNTNSDPNKNSNKLSYENQKYLEYLITSKQGKGFLKIY